MKLSEEPGDQKNREYFKRQKLPWLRSYLLERGIQMDGSVENLIYLAFRSKITPCLYASEINKC